MDDFEKELKAGFIEEALQMVSDAEQSFLSLEKDASPEVIDTIFRIAHNLKGSSKAVGFEDLSVFAHRFENLLLKIKKNELNISAGLISVLLRCNDHIKGFLEVLRGDFDGKVDSAALIEEIETWIAGGGTFESAPMDAQAQVTEVAQEEAPAVEAPVSQEQTQEVVESAAEPTVAIEAKVEEKAAPVSAEVKSAPEKTAPKEGAKVDESIRVSLSRLDRLIDFVGELVVLQTVLNRQVISNDPLLLRKTAHQMDKVLKEVQDLSMGLRMVPLKTTFQKMQRIVRDTASQLGKKINLHISGDETEMDKTLLENIGDPLVHMIRNAVDHGIESGEKRLAAGKNEEGNVWLSAYHQGGKIVVEIKDDGGGIDAEKLRQKAIEKKVIKADAKMTEKECVNLIFHPGFSTKEQVTEVSGRGVGMDVVRTNIEKLQGEVQIDTVVGKGSSFKVFLPLTLSIIDGMIIQVAESPYVIPLVHVHESMRPGPNDIKSVSGVGDILLLRGENIPLFRLAKVLGRPTSKDGNEVLDGIAIVVRQEGFVFAVLVDDILGQHQVVIKKLGAEIQVKGFSGSAILGDGRPALILELPELIKSRTSSVQRANPQAKGAAA